MPTIMEYAKKEMEFAGYSGNNKKRVQLCVYQLLQTLEAQQWRSFEAPFIINLFQKLAQYQPITPLLGTDDEWNPYSDNLLQNNRCHTVFKQIDTGQAYDTGVYMFRDAEGRCTPDKLPYSVTFPYTPEVEFIKVTSKTTTLPPPDPCD